MDEQDSASPIKKWLAAAAIIFVGFFVLRAGYPQTNDSIQRVAHALCLHDINEAWNHRDKERQADILVGVNAQLDEYQKRAVIALEAANRAEDEKMNHDFSVAACGG